ncbi:TonB family protein [Pseudophaeobacter flagellatus]|uniref:TonB family protein n=1 Tax=Pseudophaeobacter flagellatus TaxID=2899119 RepID=UPI001E4AA7C2|nr:TonB family protein [Pseudophaeobacter flagellatus]MCD9149126.1 TonB family protein [Pseudophaeobacter flagellatus]
MVPPLGHAVPRSFLAALVALVLAFGLHAAFALHDTGATVQRAGGRAALAAQGNSFVNLAAGIETPVPAPDHTATIPPVAASVPQQAVPSTVAATSPATSVKAAAALPIKPVRGGVPLVAVTPDAAADEVATPTVTPRPTRLSRQQPQLSEPQSPAVTDSLRPPQRLAEQAPQQRIAPQVPPRDPATTSGATAAPEAQQPRGNSTASAKQGAETSNSRPAGGQAAKTDGTAQVQGNAAASNYPGLVMRRIQRAKRRATVRGVAMVRFRIGAGGGLAGLSLARSSGSDKLDRIALDQVRRAAPFPPPPVGARTSFTVRIKGK